MTDEQLEAAAKERVKAIIDYISRGEFDKLTSVTLIASSWCNDGDKVGTQEDGIKEFAEWLKEQFELWKEEYDKDFVVDPLDEACLDLGDFVNDRYFAVYNPTSSGEGIDFWFEIKLWLNEKDELISEFNINV